MKRVKRAWFNTKTGEIMNRVYEYPTKGAPAIITDSRKGIVLVNKKGQVNTKNVEIMKKAIAADKAADEATKRAANVKLESLIKQRSLDNRELTSSGFLSMLESDKVDKFFVNAGYDAEEIADELGINEEDLRDPDNWNGNIFTFGALQVKFSWNNYTGDFYKVL